MISDRFAHWRKIMVRLKQWLTDVMPLHSAFTTAMEDLVRTVLYQHDTDFLDVSGRTKSHDSIISKVKRKRYKDPSTKLTGGKRGHSTF